MRLPLIKAAAEFIDNTDADYVHETIEVLEHLSQAKGIKDDELDVIGELISNLCGALEVVEMTQGNTDRKQALNTFMQRVMGSIDRTKENTHV